MNYTTAEEILNATNGGLDIILAYYPQAAECLQNRNKKFRIRGNEKTASASLKQLENGTYLVTDFGGDQKPRNGILICQLEENIDYKTAIATLAAKFNVNSNASHEVNKPIRSKRKATELEKEGTYEFDYKDELSQTELEVIFAKKVIDYAFSIGRNQEGEWAKYLNKVCANYGFHSLKSYTYIKNGEALITESTDKYPLFVIRGEGFEKIYQPMSLDKQYRFRYSGTKPKDYIFGLKRFVKSYEDSLNKHNSEQGEADEEKVVTHFKLDDVIIGSGDRDSLNVAALGYNVVWQNSETAEFPFSTWRSLKDKAHNVYILGDIDSTGLLAMHKMALQFMELKTIQLPLELRLKNDWRGNPCKDVRDYLTYWGKKAFDELVKGALEYQFWDEEYQRNKKGEYKKIVYTFNNVRAYNFIMKNGFYRYPSKTDRNGYIYIQIVDNIVKQIDASDIKSYINQFLENRYYSNIQLRNTFYRTPQLKDESLNNLKFIDLDFVYHDKKYQHFFFLNKTWRITAGEIIEYKPGEIPKMVWENRVIPHRVSKLDAPFEIIEVKHPDGSMDYDINILRQDCMFLNFLINTSRVHWRVELEERCEETYPLLADQKKYREANKFNIAGPLLTDEEKAEQKKHLINKIFVLGFMLCRYKEESRAWAPFLMDHKLSNEGESNGGSGKSIFGGSVEHFKSFLLLDGKSKTLIDDKHAFENVTEQTENILIDDLHRYAEIEPFFSIITGPMTVNPKWANRFVIPFKDSPRLAFSSNFGVRNISSSAERRLIYCAFSDYYHNNQSGSYREDRTPKDDFGKNLITDFTPEEYNVFINTMCYSLQTFMRIPVKVSPPMNNVLKRNLLGTMGDAFLNWADVYFSEENNRLNVFVPRNDAFPDFLKVANNKLYSPQKFTHAIEAWCRYYNYVYNPHELRNSQGRVIRKTYKRNNDGTYSNEQVAAEMIYIHTKEKLDAGLFKEEKEVSPAQQLLNTSSFPKENDDNIFNQI